MTLRQPPAFVLGGLNLLRAVGRAGIRAILVHTDPHDPALASRYVRGTVAIPSWQVAGEAILERLLEAARRLAGDAQAPIYYGNDDQLAWLHRFQEPLSRRFAFLVNEPDLNRTLIDKDLFYPYARDRGVLVPRFLRFDPGHPDAVEGFESALVVKPRTTCNWDASPVKSLLGHPAKARVFPNGAALLACRPAEGLRDLVVVQEYIPGNDAAIHSFHGFVDREGSLLAAFQGRKIRTFPPDTGESSFLELIKDDGFDQVGREAVRALGLKGVFKLDFKRSSSDGRFHLLEVNARFNLWHYLGAANGVNLPAVAYDYLVHGRRPERPPDYRTRYKWLSSRLDRAAFRELRRRGELGTSAWLASLVGPKVYQRFAWSDPGPLAADVIARVRALARARVTSP